MNWTGSSGVHVAKETLDLPQRDSASPVRHLRIKNLNTYRGLRFPQRLLYHYLSPVLIYLDSEVLASQRDSYFDRGQGYTRFMGLYGSSHCILSENTNSGNGRSKHGGKEIYTSSFFVFFVTVPWTAQTAYGRDGTAHKQCVEADRGFQLWGKTRHLELEMWIL